MSISTNGDSTSRHTTIVAELSANHGHRLETAIATVRAAHEAGADAIKIQTYTPDTITIDCDNEFFQIKHGTIWDGTTLYKLYVKAYTPWDWHEPIRDEAIRLGLQFFSTPFDPTAVEFLEKLSVPCYKIASFEITDIPLIELAASKKKPIIISTGIATIGEIDEAVQACRRVGNDDITLLKCTSAYPAPVEDANLATMANMRDAFGVKVGLSDHTMGSAVSIAAVALGACLIEKHFIIDRAIGGPDASFSMEPKEFRTMVEAIRDVEKSIGRVSYNQPDFPINGRAFSRSLFVIKDMRAGEIFCKANIRSIRPGDGLPPASINKILGKSARCDISRGTPLAWDLID